MENQDQVFHPSHRPWKSLRDSHIPTALTTVPIYKDENQARLKNRLAKQINHLGWAKLKCRSGPNVVAKRTLVFEQVRRTGRDFSSLTAESHVPTFDRITGLRKTIFSDGLRCGHCITTRTPFASVQYLADFME
jgi:hypothetical protein